MTYAGAIVADAKRTEGAVVMDEPKRRGRPPTGRTPDAERQRRSRQARAEAGGKQVSLILSPDATVALGLICLREGEDEKAALERALIGYARRYL